MLEEVELRRTDNPRALADTRNKAAATDGDLHSLDAAQRTDYLALSCLGHVLLLRH